MSNLGLCVTAGVMAVGVAISSGQTAGPATAPVGIPQVSQPPRQDGPVYQVSEFQIEYAQPRAGLPPLPSLMKTQVVLGQSEGVYVAPGPGAPRTRVLLARLVTDGGAFRAGAIQSLNQQIVGYYNQRGLIGVIVAPHPADVDPRTGRDLRPQQSGTMRLVIHAAVVADVRTVASGERVPESERISSPVHERIRRGSPLQPPSARGAVSGDLLRRDVLDEYVYLLNRHPGRRVDVAVSPTQTPDGVSLDYLVSETKPWTAYAQASNTGTEETSDWRERFGFIHNQLTGRDDILSIDHVTAGFEDSNAVVASYAAPFFDLQRLRWSAYGSYSDFTASDVGFPGEEFTGTTWQGGGELVWNFLQRRDLFADVIGGARFQSVSVDNELLDESGDTDFLVPYVGLRLERMRDTSTVLASTTLSSGSAVSGEDEVEFLGNPGADDDWAAIQAELNNSFYLEPLLRNPPATLAHEAAWSVRGQYAFDYRLIPEEQQVLGGLYTVRGYPESVVAGDSVVVATAEYRYHIPRGLSTREEPGRLLGQPFRWAPQQPLGRPDWDLIFRTFVDAGRTWNNDGDAGIIVDNETLVGTGLGLELLIRRNISVRADWGVAMNEIGDPADDNHVSAGSNRFHFVFTVLY